MDTPHVINPFSRVIGYQGNFIKADDGIGRIGEVSAVSGEVQAGLLRFGGSIVSRAIDVCPKFALLVRAYSGDPLDVWGAFAGLRLAGFGRPETFRMD